MNERYDGIVAALLSKHYHLRMLLVGTSWWNGRREHSLGYGRLVGRVRRSIDRLMNDKEDHRTNERSEDVTATTKCRHESSSSAPSVQSNRVLMKQRVCHITGLSRPNYLRLLAAVNLVLDPVTEDGSGTESGLLMALET